MPNQPVRLFRGAEVYFLVAVKHDWVHRDIPTVLLYMGERVRMKVVNHTLAHLTHAAGSAPYEGYLLIATDQGVLQAAPHHLSVLYPQALQPSWHSTVGGQNLSLEEIPFADASRGIHYITEDIVMIELRAPLGRFRARGEHRDSTIKTRIFTSQLSPPGFTYPLAHNSNAAIVEN